MTRPDDWEMSGKPTRDGIYAICYCWEVEEGIFNGAAEFRRGEWRSTLPISAFAGPFDSEAQAKAWALAHDPEGP